MPEPGQQASGRSSVKKALLAGLGTIVVGLIVAWFTPAGPALWHKVFPLPTLSVGVQFPRGQCGIFELPNGQESSSSAGGSEAYGSAEWAAATGAAESEPMDQSSGYGFVELTITGQDSHAVILTGMHFNVTRHPGPMSRNEMSSECGSDEEYKYAQVDLDANPPKIDDSSGTVITWSSDDPRKEPLRFPYKVTDGDAEPFLLVVHTKQYVDWTVTLDWSSGGESGEQVVNNHGQPFRTSVPPIS